MERVLLVQTIADSGLMTLIWLVQLIIYPSFSYAEDKGFIRWHKRYSRLISYIVIPLMLAQFGVELLYCLQKEIRWHRVVPIALIWTSTFSLSVPCHNRLQRDGKDLLTINRLVRTNWLRTLLWSILFLETVKVHFTL